MKKITISAALAAGVSAVIAAVIYKRKNTKENTY